MPSTPIQMGQLFAEFNSLRNAIQDWAVADQFEFRMQLKDATRVDYRCKTSSRRGEEGECKWRVYAARAKDGSIKIGKIINEHICLGAAPTARPVRNQQSWLRRHIPTHLIVTKQTTPREIQQTMQLHHNTNISYQAAHEAYTALANDNIDYERISYQKLPSYITLLRQKNPDVYTNLELLQDGDIPRFSRVFICPAQAKRSFHHCRKFIALDGTFCKARFIQILLLAVTIDANGHIVLLAWAIVEGENKESWSYFMRHLRNAIPEITEVDCTVISDREKGLMVATDILGPRITRAHCTFHLRENFKRFGKGITDIFFWKIANARTEMEYDTQMALLRQEKPAAAEYLTTIDRTLWVTAFFPGHRYGHNTSNIVESLNNSLKNARELPILDLLNEIWHSQMALRFRRLQQANHLNNQNFTPYCINLAQASSIWAQQNTVRMASRIQGEVQQQNDRERGSNRVFTVNLETRKCSCLKFQENGIPCSHAWACILSIGQAPNTYFPAILSVEIWKEIYSENWNPVTIEGLALQACHPPVGRRLPGRPKVRRAIRGDRGLAALNHARRENGEEVPNREQKCGNCNSTSHNRRTCTTPSN